MRGTQITADIKAQMTADKISGNQRAKNQRKSAL